MLLLSLPLFILLLERDVTDADAVADDGADADDSGGAGGKSG